MLINCFPCRNKGIYDLESIKFFLSNGWLCDDHKKKAEEAIASAPKKVILKNGEQKVFVPKKVEVKANYQDREPGEEG